MENQKGLEKLLSECLEANSRLKKEISYCSTKCRKLEYTEDVTLPTKMKDLHDYGGIFLSDGGSQSRGNFDHLNLFKAKNNILYVLNIN